MEGGEEEEKEEEEEHEGVERPRHVDSSPPVPLEEQHTAGNRHFQARPPLPSAAHELVVCKHISISTQVSALREKPAHRINPNLCIHSSKALFLPADKPELRISCWL